MYRQFFKKLIDIGVSFVLLLLFSPMLILVTIFLFFRNNGKPIFIQSRPGKNGKIFKLIKFKTMNDKKDENGELLPPAKRITPIGKFVRSSSLDEIPQLINVIKGDMSIVGPRPLRVEYLPHYSEEQAKRHNVLPGITGWAQIKGRNAISWEERFKLDVWYVDNVSFVLDLKILFLTVSKVFKKEGVNQKKDVTMEPFKEVKLDG